MPLAPPYVQAVWASQHYVGFREHSFPDCFVCGPHRRRGDGMRIFPGLLDSGMVAAPWIPADDLDGGDGKVAVEFHWAALDCPGYFAAIGDTPRTMLLGEMQAHVDRRVHVGEACMVLGWLIASEGRKHRCGTAIFDEDGELCARALATWIEVALEVGRAAVGVDPSLPAAAQAQAGHVAHASRRASSAVNRPAAVSRTPGIQSVRNASQRIPASNTAAPTMVWSRRRALSRISRRSSA